ncbi:hypothetical protein TWF481_005683 [Arthrobotrys musiformis]|uniref:Peptidase metallopeptidase domain-containing protein n=1 Tax=Arthrobotrys musiformis TaxID=47236 RepID=A0AAV9WEL7_9PEZI
MSLDITTTGPPLADKCEHSLYKVPLLSHLSAPIHKTIQYTSHYLQPIPHKHKDIPYSSPPRGLAHSSEKTLSQRFSVAKSSLQTSLPHKLKLRPTLHKRQTQVEVAMASRPEIDACCGTERSGLDEINLGVYDEIPLYKQGSDLVYYVDSKTFMNPACDGEYIAACFALALASWGILPISFTRTDNPGDAHFHIAGRAKAAGNVYARSFFPNTTTPPVLKIYELGIKNFHAMVNILAHEIGHILGLRHEFARRKPKELTEPAVLFGAENPSSVMNYHHDLLDCKVTEQDRQELRRFYTSAYTHGWDQYQGLRIKFVSPDKWRRRAGIQAYGQIDKD